MMEARIYKGRATWTQQLSLRMIRSKLFCVHGITIILLLVKNLLMQEILLRTGTNGTTSSCYKMMGGFWEVKWWW